MLKQSLEGFMIINGLTCLFLCAASLLIPMTIEIRRMVLSVGLASFLFFLIAIVPFVIAYVNSLVKGSYNQ